LLKNGMNIAHFLHFNKLYKSKAGNNFSTNKKRRKEMTNHTSKMTIEYMLFVHENWHFYLAATKGSLCFVGTNGSDFEELSQWAHKHYLGYPLVDNPAALSLYAEEFHAYFERKSTSFTFHTT